MFYVYAKINGIMTYITATSDYESANNTASYYHNQGYYTEILNSQIK